MFDKAKQVVEERDQVSINADTGDHSFNYVMNALFIPVDMTEYEDAFVGEYWSHYSLPNSDEARSVNNDEEGYDENVDTPGFMTKDDRKLPKFGMTNNLDMKREEIPEEVEDEKPERDFGDEDEEEPELEAW